MDGICSLCGFDFNRFTPISSEMCANPKCPHPPEELKAAIALAEQEMIEAREKAVTAERYYDLLRRKGG